MGAKKPAPKNETLMQDVRVHVAAWGAQEQKVTSHSAPFPFGHICVGVGQVLTYCYDRSALETIADAWVDAIVMAERLKMTEEPVPDPWWQNNGEVAVSMQAMGKQEHQVLGVAAQASPNGRRHLALTVGRMTVRVYDLAALESYAAAWALALECGAVFGPAETSFKALREARKKTLP